MCIGGKISALSVWGINSPIHKAAGSLVTGHSLQNGKMSMGNCCTERPPDPVLYGGRPSGGFVNRAVNPFFHFLQGFNVQYGWRTIGGSKGGEGRHRGPNSFNFMQFFGGKFGKIVCCRPLPEGLTPPPRGNPGSATVHWSYRLSVYRYTYHWRIQGGRQGSVPPGSKFFHFHAVFGKKIEK